MSPVAVRRQTVTSNSVRKLLRTQSAMLRPLLKSSVQRRAAGPSAKNLGPRAFATQSGDDAEKPTALAKIFLEDGTELVGKSFGSHESVEGEVRRNNNFCDLEPAVLSDGIADHRGNDIGGIAHTLNNFLSYSLSEMLFRWSSPLEWSDTQKT